MTPTPVPVCPLTGPFNVLCFQVSGFSGIIGAVAAIIFVLAIVIALFYLLWGAAKWINSGGDKAAIEGARGQIIGVAIGLIVIFLIFLLLNVLLKFFNIDLTSIVIPNL